MSHSGSTSNTTPSAESTRPSRPRRSARFSAQTSASLDSAAAVDTTATETPAAAQEAGASTGTGKRKRSSDLDPEAGSAEASSESSSNRRRLSTSNPSSSTQPSAKALGKRRAASPELLQDNNNNNNPSTSVQSNKKRRKNQQQSSAGGKDKSKTPAASTSYNLRRRQSAPPEPSAEVPQDIRSEPVVADNQEESPEQGSKNPASSKQKRSSKASKPKMPTNKKAKASKSTRAARDAEVEQELAQASGSGAPATQDPSDALPPSGARAAKKGSRRTPKSSAAAETATTTEDSAPTQAGPSAPRAQSADLPMQVNEPIGGEGDDVGQQHDFVIEYSDENDVDDAEDEDFDDVEEGDEDDIEQLEDDPDHPFGLDAPDHPHHDHPEGQDDRDLAAEFAEAAAAVMGGAGASGMGAEGDEDEEDDEDEDEDMDDDGGIGGGLGGLSGGPSERSGLFGSFAASLASFGMMSGTNGRLKNILNVLRDRSSDPDPTQKLVALQELSEILSISTEDTLAGFFNIDGFVKEFMYILNTNSAPMSVIDLYGEESGVEMMLLACRCLANLMEALPGSSHSVVYAGAVPVLCSKLVEIQYIDLAEQTLSTLEKIASELPGSVVREGGLSALLSFLDFFSTNVQRTAVTAAAHCCRSLSPDSFQMVRDVIPILRNVLGYEDQRVVEQACLAVTRIIESYRHYPDKLESILTPDLFSSLLTLLTPGSSLLTSSTFTSLLRALSSAARVSAKVAMELIESNISATIYHLLAGATAPPPGQEIAGVRARHEEDDMAVLQNLVHRPKDQVLEALALTSELLPALPKDGLFSSKPNASRSKAQRKIKVKREEDTAASAPVPSHGSHAGLVDMPSSSVASNDAAADSTSAAAGTGEATSTIDRDEDAVGAASQVKTEERSPSVDLSAPASSASPHRSLAASSPFKSIAASKEQANEHRIELLQSSDPSERKEAVARFHALLLPTLLDVYSASVGINVRSKSMLGLTKMMHFAPKEQLRIVLDSLPLASFLGAVLASKDQSALVINGLQVVELLLVKLPDMSNYLFRRQGVLYEVERLAEVPLANPSKDKDEEKAKQGDLAAASSSTGGMNRGFLLGSLARASLSAAEVAANEAANESHLKDLVTLRARFMKDRYCSANSASQPAIQAAKDLEHIKMLVARLESCDEQAPYDRSELQQLLMEVAALFVKADQPISSFELLESGLVSALLKFAGDARDYSEFAMLKRKMLARAFVPPQGGPPQALSMLVKCLQDSLSRLEDFDVVTAAQGAADDRRSASMLARQLKLRLVADDSDVPRSCSNVIVSIHAIATFQAFNDYLRPRISEASSLSHRSSSVGALASAFEAATAAASEPRSAESGRVSTSFGASQAPQDPDDNGDPELRRRSSRLSGKTSTADLREGGEPSSTSTPRDLSEAQDPIDEQAADDSVREEHTTNLEPVGDDSSRVEGHTPGGTRVGTPAGSARPTAGMARPRGSYASALKTPSASDWHLKFYMGEQEISLDTTVFGAVHQFENRQGTSPSRAMWSNIYTVRFKKFPGLASAPSPQLSPEPVRDVDANPLPDSVAPDSKEARILHLLKALQNINADLPELLSAQQQADSNGLPQLAFVNNKLTAKLNRQLEEPMIVASSCLPDWAVDLPQAFPFLFPFETRFSFLQSTSFGYARLMQKWITAARQESRRDDSLGFLGRLQRQKVRIARERMLESAVKVFELYGSSRAMLEIEFFSEVGTGLGPTLEFYALASQEFSRKDLGMWRAGEENPSIYTQSKTGLFPAPLSESDEAGAEKVTSMFRVLGLFVAKGLMDSRIIDIGFNRSFMKLVQGRKLPLEVATMKSVDPALGKSLEDLQAYVTAKHEILDDDFISDKTSALQNIRLRDAAVEDLSLDFTLPGYPNIELCPHGSDTTVTIDNVDEYIHAVLEYTLQTGVQRQVRAFREGFSQVFPVRDLACFSPEEMVLVFGAGAEDWSCETMQDALRADHGFSMESKPVKDVVEVMQKFPESKRRLFLKFATGSPRLPVGGFRALHPPLTIVRKLPESGHHADEYLPSVMTCQNYIKLPEYSSRSVLEERLGTAMTEGQGAFHLS